MVKDVLDDVYTATGTAPTAEYSDSMSAGRALVPFGYIYYYTKDSYVKTLYDSSKRDMMNKLYNGYLQYYTHVPTEADQQAVAFFIDLATKLDDTELFEIAETIALGLTNKRDSSNWGQTTYAGYKMTTTIYTGYEYGTINQHLLSSAIIMSAYMSSLSSLYHDSTVEEYFYSSVQLAEDYQRTSGTQAGCIPRTGSQINECDFGYNLASLTWLSEMYFLMKVNGDITLDGNSLTDKILNIVYKDCEYLRRFGFYTIPGSISEYSVYPVCLPKMEEDGNDVAIHTLIKNMIIFSDLYVENVGLRYDYSYIEDPRGYPIYSFGSFMYVPALWDKYDKLYWRWV